MDRLPLPKSQGRRDILAIILLVVPLVAIGYYLAVIEVAVDPPVPIATPTVVSTPVASPGASPAGTGTPPPETPPATPASGNTGAGPDARERADTGPLPGTNRSH